MSDEEQKPFYKNKKVVVGAASSGVIGFTSVVFGYIDSKIDDVNKRIDEKYIVVREYVQEKNLVLENRLENMETILVRIDDRMYELIKTKNKGE